MIDDKLREILKQNAGFDGGFEMSGDAGWGGNLNNATLDVMIPQIKQAFVDEGYIQIPETRVSFDKGEQWVDVRHAGKVRKNGVELKSGQEWYDRFGKELGDLSNGTTELLRPEIFEAARKAAGL